MERKYPTHYELIQVLNMLHKSVLDEFAQSRGIFITKAGIPELASELAKQFFDNEDLEVIRSKAYHRSSSHALSGFTVKTKNKEFNLKSVYQGIFDSGIYQKLEQKLTAPVLVEPEKQVYKASLTYRKIRPGRIEFLQDETTSFEFQMEPLGDGSWQVEVDSNRSTDIKALQDLFKEGISNDYDIEELEQDLLTDSNSIDFFDRLSKHGMSDEYRFSDIKHLTLKRGTNNSSEDNEEGEKEVSGDELVGISQAVLEGKNLRENMFVQKSVESGYRFNAMTYEFEHIKSTKTLQLKAEFKGRPKVFEISILGGSENSEITLTKIPMELSAKESRYLRSVFWNKAKEIYLDILKTPFTKAMSFGPDVDNQPVVVANDLAEEIVTVTEKPAKGRGKKSQK
ncbi:hypothetical protein VRU48_06670 [Pedobacter sp. KR3-3]|uniref:Uncharacterized protein n=1 Tax=Pedobacter albus TaxID=3113905 RepID=A0ABU7I5Z7_9SPHI|nr:hypothetical protein [Pedobacter sp. KR3-3]MEE1944782.1 hypothetical protein [Pedobacter sp. KR3-3]